MRDKPITLSDVAEAAVLDQMTVRLIERAEQGRWDQEVSQHHYLKNAHLVGKRLCYVVEYQGQWLGLLGGWASRGDFDELRDAVKEASSIWEIIALLQSRDPTRQP